MADALDTLYRGRLATGNAALLARIQVAWGMLFDPANPQTSIARIAGVVAAWTTAAQAGAAGETTAYLRAQLAAAEAVAPAEVPPLSVPTGLVGVADSGESLGSLCATAVPVYWNRIGRGLGDTVAANSAQSYLNRVAASEPYRAANATAVHNADEDERFTGRVTRLTRAGACDFCVTIADRGYIPAHAGFAAHANCRCTASPEISSHVYSRAAIRRGRAALEGPQFRVVRDPMDQLRADASRFRGDLGHIFGVRTGMTDAQYARLRQLGSDIDAEVLRRLEWDPGMDYDHAGFGGRSEYNKMAFKVLGEMRPMGGLRINASVPNRGYANRLESDAQPFYPDDWLAASNARGSFDVIHSSRGYYADMRQEMALSSGPGVVSHEMFHRMEKSVPGVIEAEGKWLAERTPGEKPQPLKQLTGNSGYGPDETARPDKFTNPYIGKNYYGQAYEIGSMGMQGMAWDDGRIDADHMRLMLGMLGGL